MATNKELLPQKYKFSHDFCLELHDHLVSIIVNGEPKKIFAYEIKFDGEETESLWRSEAQYLVGSDLWDWLETNDYQYVNRELSYRHLIVALLSDFCHFILTALQTSAKGKLSVTYALLRKPLKDNLLLLEWLMGNPDEFLDKFLKEPIHHIDIGKINPDKKKSIIKEALEKGKLKNALTADFLFDLRYNKTASYGFEGLWNKATHIITAVNAYATEDKNLNFIFSDWNAKVTQWDYLYDYLPLILFHTTEIVDNLIQNICTVEPDDRKLSHLKRLVGYMLWTEKRPSSLERLRSLDLLEGISKGLGVKCRTCSKELYLVPQEAEQFFYKSYIKCPHCHRNNYVSPYSSITQS